MSGDYRRLKAAFFAIIAFIAILTDTNVAAFSKAAITIDGNLPLTGPIAAFCGDYPKAFNMGIDDACKHLSVPRESFAIDFQDNAGQPAQGVSVVKKQLLSSYPSLYISGTSPVSVVIAKEVGEANIPHMMVSFDAFLCRNGKNRLRILPNYKIEGPVFVEYAKKIKAKKVFIFSVNHIASNEQIEKIIKPGLAQLGIQSQCETYGFDTKDFRTIVLKAAQYKPDLILIAGCYSVHVYPIIGALKNYGLVKKDNVLCTLDFIDLIHNKTPTSELAGIPFITPLYEITLSNNERKDWAERFQKTYKKEPSYVEAYAYDTGRIMVAAYKKYGKVDAQSIRKVLPFNGICGPINIDQDGDLNTKLKVAQVMPDGSVRILK